MTGNFGNGRDGSAVLDGINTVTWASKTGTEYTLLRNVFLKNLTLLGNAKIKPCSTNGGFYIKVKDLLKLSYNTVIDDDGKAAVGGTAGAALGSASFIRFAGSGVGATGISTSGAGIAGTAAPSTGNSECPYAILPYRGGPGGTASAQAGGAGGSPLRNNFNVMPWPGSIYWHEGNTLDGNSGSPHRHAQGSGGGSGGCDVTTGTATSGAGGSGGGAVFISARRIDNAGRISARGGNGGNAIAADGGIAGGGGGGSGGVVAVLYEEEIGDGLGVIDACGGAGGLGAGNGAVGGNGADGPVYILCNGNEEKISRRTVRITGIGDSLTQRGTATWIDHIADEFEFVGTAIQAGWAQPQGRQCEGHPAYTSSQLLSGLPGWYATYPKAPTHVLIFAGVCDVINSVSTATIVENIAKIAQTTRATFPGARITFVKVTPLPNYSSGVTSLNNAIAADTRFPAQDLLDLNTLGTDYLFADQVHISSDGEKWIANKVMTHWGLNRK